MKRKKRPSKSSKGFHSQTQLAKALKAFHIFLSFGLDQIFLQTASFYEEAENILAIFPYSRILFSQMGI